MTSTEPTASIYGPIPVASARVDAVLASAALTVLVGAAVGAAVVPWLAIIAVGAGAGYSLSGSV